MEVLSAVFDGLSDLVSVTCRPLARGRVAQLRSSKLGSGQQLDADSPWMAPIRRLTLSPERRTAPVF